jgi:hypothetical protein
MIYTCYEMIRDCRADRPEGWSYFIRSYVPVIRRLVEHYGGGAAGGAAIERVLGAVRNPESSLFQTLDPAPERWFVAELRQEVLAELAAPEPEIDLPLETVATALEPLTLLERQAAWLETMRYDAARTATLLRMAPATVEKIRARAGDLIRGQVDTWRGTLLAENGAALGRAAAAQSSPACLAPKTFLDMLDGRTTWRGREELEQHAMGCWHCIDHLCRLVEVVELLRGIQPLSEAEFEPARVMLGLSPRAERGRFRLP